MIKNIIFDVGEVLINFRYREYMLEDLGFSEETTDYLSDNLVNSAKWGELDEGVTTQEEAIQYFRENLTGYGKEVDLFWSQTEKLVREYDYAPGLLRDLKDKGYNVYILSNYPEEMYKLHWPTFKFLREADGAVVSALEKLAKPDEKIYRLLLDMYDLKAEESVFIDDRPANIEGAEKVGMHGILFTGFDKFREDLEQLLNNC